MATFYRPQPGAAGDFIPFYWQGEYHLFYLRDWRDSAQPGISWWHLATRDFVHFQERGEAIPRGAPDQLDADAWTGSVIARGGTFHLFYTGHSDRYAGTGAATQVVLRATSSDLDHWTKDPEFALWPPSSGYETADWRDPFVFWNEQAAEYWMLVAARRDRGPGRHRGCVALLASPDLEAWELRAPLWAPDLYYTHECPDLFRLGDWWYLVYSTFSECFATHYRMGRSPAGPWLAPAQDTFDGRAYYAAKTAGEGDTRYLFGWLATREEEKDTGGWQWGGDLVVHQLAQQPDGSLAVRAPQSVLAPFSQPVAPAPRPVLGDWQVQPGQVAAQAAGRFSALALGPLPEEGLLETAVTYQPGTASCGLLLRADQALDHYYQLRLEPARQRIVFDRWPRPGDEPFTIERPLALAPGNPVTLRVLVDGTCLVAYADDRVALSCRMYDHREGEWGVFVSEGAARFGEPSLRTRGG